MNSFLQNLVHHPRALRRSITWAQLLTQSDSPEPKCLHSLVWQDLNPYHKNRLKERRINFGSWRIGRSNSKKERNDFSIRFVILPNFFCDLFPIFCENVIFYQKLMNHKLWVINYDIKNASSVFYYCVLLLYITINIPWENILVLFLVNFIQRFCIDLSSWTSITSNRKIIGDNLYNNKAVIFHNLRISSDYKAWTSLNLSRRPGNPIWFSRV